MTILLTYELYIDKKNGYMLGKMEFMDFTGIFIYFFLLIATAVWLFCTGECFALKGIMQ